MLPLIFQGGAFNLDQFVEKISYHGYMAKDRAMSLLMSVLMSPGPCTPLRVVQRHFSGMRADTVMMAMMAIQRPRHHPDFMGYLSMAKKKIRVFFKCPPDLVSPSALAFYGISLEAYTKQYNSTAKQDPMKPADYIQRIMETCPSFTP